MYFFGYANYSTVLLAYDAESHTVKQIHHAYVDKFNIRTHEDETLTQTPNSVALQDVPASVLNSARVLDPTKVTLVTSYLKEERNILDSGNCATMTVSLPIVNEPFGICLDINTIFGFPNLSGVDISSPLQT